MVLCPFTLSFFLTESLNAGSSLAVYRQFQHAPSDTVVLSELLHSSFDLNLSLEIDPYFDKVGEK
jgi:hypothetical protein